MIHTAHEALQHRQKDKIQGTGTLPFKTRRATPLRSLAVGMLNAAAAQPCPLLSAASVPAEPFPLDSVAPWRPVRNPPAMQNSTDVILYIPPDIATLQGTHAFRAVLRANQFPANRAACSRMLLMYDDALTTGLGYTSRLMVLALLLAVKEKRVLIPMPHPTRRWCARPPYTLNCMYEAWTHCPLPTGIPRIVNASKWSHRFSHRQWLASPVVRISTAQVHRETFLMGRKTPDSAFAIAAGFLFRPREWVRDAARCQLRANGLKSGQYVVVHVRHSEEKKKERGNTLPALHEYPAAVEAALVQGNTSQLFLQTATPVGMAFMRKWCAARGVTLIYTSNERATHDLWMQKTEKADVSGEQHSVVAQAVNALIASMAGTFISPISSMWTWFVVPLMKDHAFRRNVSAWVRQRRVAVPHTMRLVVASTGDHLLREGSNQELGEDQTRGDLKQRRVDKPRLYHINID